MAGPIYEFLANGVREEVARRNKAQEEAREIQKRRDAINALPYGTYIPYEISQPPQITGLTDQWREKQRAEQEQWKRNVDQFIRDQAAGANNFGSSYSRAVAGALGVPGVNTSAQTQAQPQQRRKQTIRKPPTVAKPTFSKLPQQADSGSPYDNYNPFANGGKKGPWQKTLDAISGDSGSVGADNYGGLDPASLQAQQAEQAAWEKDNMYKDWQNFAEQSTLANYGGTGPDIPPEVMNQSMWDRFDQEAQQWSQNQQAQLAQQAQQAQQSFQSPQVQDYFWNGQGAGFNPLAQGANPQADFSDIGDLLAQFLGTDGLKKAYPLKW